MAQKILKNCAKIVSSVHKRIFSKEFLLRHRKAEKYFIRNVKLTFPVLIIFLMNLLKNSLQIELDQFFNLNSQNIISRPTVVKSAFTKARKKLSYTAFIEMNELLVKETKENIILQTWDGFRLVAIDGSTIKVPNTDEIRNHFGVQKSGTEKDCPMARISQSFDVLNKISLDTCILPIENTDELTVAYQHIKKAEENDLFLFDRGYPAFWLFAVLLHKHVEFCARVKISWSNATRKFNNSGKKDQIVEISSSSLSKRTLRELGLDVQSIKVRFIRVELDTGETEILITSLLDQKKYPSTLFKELYFYRWPIEEDYKTMKYRLELGNFSGKTVESIYQDFHAKVFSKNLTTVLSIPAKEIINYNNAHRQHKYKSNFTTILSKMKNTIVHLLNEINPLSLIKEFQYLVITMIEPVRYGRKNKRKKGIKRRVFHTGYKSCL